MARKKRDHNPEIGKDQVRRTMEQAASYGVTEFQVTSHGSNDPRCSPHEGKVYTIDPNNTKFEYMTPDRVPPFFENCRHRLLPRSFTKSQIAIMPDIRTPGTE